MKTSAAMKLSDDELRFKAALLMGATDVRTSNVFSPSIQPLLEAYYPESEGGGEPDDWCPIPDYHNNLSMAMTLWLKMPEPKEIWWGDGVVDVCWGAGDSHQEYAHWIETTGVELLPGTLTRAFIIENG